MRYWLVMPAAGTGRRFADALPKQYAPLNDRTVIEWALSSFLSDARCAGIAVALAAGDRWWPRIAERLPAVTVATGGAHRSQSVRQALAVLSRHLSAEDWVLVHDAARPCLSPEDRDQLTARCSAHAVGGLLAAPLSDTLKQAAGDGTATQTIDRTGVWRALTPQMFRYGRLCAALDQALTVGRFPTDEAQALEWLGERPLLVEGSPANIKITQAQDLLVAAALLKARSPP